MITVKGIRKSYGNKEILKGIDFEVKKGEIVSIIGRNGVGKTTLVDIICKLKKQDAGGVNYAFDEEKLYEYIGVQTQDSQFDERFKVREVCELWQDLYNGNCLDYKELAITLGLTEVMNQKVKTLSGGQKQKLSILIALIHEPECLILDELTIGLDAYSRGEIQKLIKKLNTEERRTVIMVSHYMEEVEAIFDKVIVLKDGVIFCEGSPAEIIKKYNCKSLQDFAVNNLI